LQRKTSQNCTYHAIWLFEYLFTPFGLSNAAQTFQSMIDHVFSKLEAVFANMNNSGAGPPDGQTYLVHLEVLFAALAANGLTINPEKCVFAVPTLEIMATRSLQ
jgi:hypothetical protein